MSVSVVQTKSDDSNGISVTTIAVTFDSAPVEGDLLRAMLVTRFGAGTVTPPTGWTLEAQDISTSANCFVYFKIAGAAESSTVTFSWTSSRRATLMAREYSGVDTGSYVDVSSSNPGTAKPHSTGTTGVIAAGNTYAEAWFGVDDTSNWTSTRSYTNSYVESSAQQENGTNPAAYVASNNAVTPGGTTETALDTASAGATPVWGHLVVFQNGPLVAGTASLTNRTATTASLEATDAGGGTDPYTYQWHRSETQGFTPSGGNAVAGATSLTLNDTGLTDATTYYYVLVYTDDAAATVNSNEVEVTTSGNPLVVITDFNDATSGTVQIMGPGIAMFTIAGSMIGTGVWHHSKIEWDFGRPGGAYNEHRGVNGGHFYDVEPVSNTDYTVTCTITNSGGLSSSATRTVRVTPNTRRIVFVDPDTGSATPTDPTDSGDPYDTIASCVGAETQADLEIQCTAGKTHIGAEVGGTGSSNVILRSTVKGTKFTLTATSNTISGGDTIGLRDASFAVSAVGVDVRMLDQRAGTPYRCWVVDCDSVDPEVCGLVTSGTSKQTLMQNVTTRHAGTNDYWVAGDQIVLHNTQSPEYTGNERPYRGDGDWLTMNQCGGVYKSIDGKSVLTKSGGQWTYLYRCTFEVGEEATNGSSTCMKIGHNVDANIVTFIAEQCLLLMKPVLAGSEVCLHVGTTGETSVTGVCIRNCIMAGARNLVYFEATDVLGGDDIDFLHNTMIVSDTNDHLNLLAKYGSTFFANNLLLGYTTKGEVVNLSDTGTNDPLLVNNVAPVATSDDDIRVDGNVNRDDWATFNATALGSGNLSKNIAYDSGTYRPTDTTDADLLKTVLAEMGAVPEDYYGTERTGSVWVAGAVGTAAVVDPDPDPEEPGSGGGSVPGAVYRFAALRNTLRLRSQNCDDPRLTETQRLECRRRQQRISRNG